MRQCTAIKQWLCACLHWWQCIHHIQSQSGSRGTLDPCNGTCNKNWRMAVSRDMGLLPAESGALHHTAAHAEHMFGCSAHCGRAAAAVCWFLLTAGKVWLAGNKGEGARGRNAWQAHGKSGKKGRNAWQAHGKSGKRGRHLKHSYTLSSDSRVHTYVPGSIRLAALNRCPAGHSQCFAILEEVLFEHFFDVTDPFL